MALRLSVDVPVDGIFTSPLTVDLYRTDGRTTPVTHTRAATPPDRRRWAPRFAPASTLTRSPSPPDQCRPSHRRFGVVPMWSGTTIGLILAQARNPNPTARRTSRAHRLALTSVFSGAVRRTCPSAAGSRLEREQEPDDVPDVENAGGVFPFCCHSMSSEGQVHTMTMASANEASGTVRRYQG